MIYAINAFALGFIAAIWSKSGAPNILLAAFFVGLALINAALSAPTIYRLLGI